MVCLRNIFINTFHKGDNDDNDDDDDDDDDDNNNNNNNNNGGYVVVHKRQRCIRSVRFTLSSGSLYPRQKYHSTPHKRSECGGKQNNFSAQPRNRYLASDTAVTPRAGSEYQLGYAILSSSTSCFFSTSIRPLSLPSKSFPIHHPPINLQSTIYFRGYDVVNWEKAIRSYTHTLVPQLSKL